MSYPIRLAYGLPQRVHGYGQGWRVINGAGIVATDAVSVVPTHGRGSDTIRESVGRVRTRPYGESCAHAIHGDTVQTGLHRMHGGCSEGGQGNTEGGQGYGEGGQGYTECGPHGLESTAGPLSSGAGDVHRAPVTALMDRLGYWSAARRLRAPNRPRGTSHDPAAGTAGRGCRTDRHRPRQPLDRRHATCRHVWPKRAGLRPGHRAVSTTRGLRLDRGGRRRRCLGQGRFPGLARDVDLEAHRDPVSHPQPRRAAPPRDRGTAHGGARQGAVRRARRGRPGTREPRVRHGHSASAQGRFQRAGLGRRRRVPDPPAAGRGGRHHAVQLPGHGADVDVRQRDRVRQRVHPQAVGEGPVRVALHRRASRRGRRAGGRLQRDPGRQGGGGPNPRAPGHQGRQLRRLDTDRALHLRDRHAQREARPGARRCQEPHDRAARCRPRHGGRRCGVCGVRQLGRALHGHLRGRRGWRDRRPARRRDQGATASASRSGPAPIRPHRWGRW